VIYFDVPDASRPVGFSPLENVPPPSRPLAASNMLEVFKKIWADSWGPRLEHILGNALLALMDQPEATLADVLRLLSDKEFRKRPCERVANPQVREFWLREYESYPSGFRAESIALVSPMLASSVPMRESARVGPLGHPAPGSSRPLWFF